MRYSILGFRQEDLIKYNIDMSGVLLLDYIQKALSQTSMIKIFEDGQPYVWLNHDKILEDLPILNIKKRMLSNKLSKLTEFGLIKSINKSNDKGKGSKVYYTITEKVEDMQYDKESTTSKKLHVVERPQVKNYTSNNKLNNNDNKLSNNNFTINSKVENQEVFLGSAKNNSKNPKKSLYSNCIDLINGFTDNDYLRKLLEKFLKICIQNSKEGEYPFYQNHFKGKLNRLQELSDNSYEQIDIVQEAVKNGYSKFYTIKSDNKSNKSMQTVNGKFQDNIEPDTRDLTGKEFEEVNEGF